MRQYKVARRYSNALFTLAVEENKLEEVKKDIDWISSVKHEELKRVLRSPFIRPDKKIAIFKAVFEGKLSPLTISFFNLIFSKGRSVALEDIEIAFNEQYNLHKGIHILEFTSAHPVSEEMINEIRFKVQNLERFKGKNVQMTEKIDPSLVGGFVLQLGDQLFDASILNDLRHIKKQFIENMYVQALR